MSTDNPIMEPADVFYKSSEESEPLKPTESPDVAKAEQSPQQEVKETEKPDEAGAKAEDEPEELEAEGEEEEALYVEIDGEEHNLDDVKKWRDGHMMQSDYTKKTTALAEERKAFDAERESERGTLTKTKSEVSEMRDQLAVLVAEDEEIDWAELKEDDPDKYIELKEKADKRIETLAKIKAERETPSDDPALVQAEQRKLFAANPAWLDEEGKVTDAYKKDVALINGYAAKAGFEAEEFSKMVNANMMNALLKAAKFDELQAKGKEINDKRKTVPVVTKPKANEKASAPKPAHEVFYGT